MMSVLQRLGQLLFHNHSPRQTIIKNTFWLFLAEGISRGSVLLVTVLFGRLLGPTVFGQYSYLLVISSFVIIFADLGISQYTAREYQHLPISDRLSYLRSCLYTKLLLSVGVIIVLFSIVAIVAENMLMRGIGATLILQLIAHSALEFLRAVFRSLQESQQETAIKLLHGLGNLLLIPLLLSTHSIVLTLLVQGVLTALIVVYTRYRISRTLPQESTSITNSYTPQALIRAGWMFALSGLFVNIYYYADSLFIQWFRPYDLVGYYNAAYKIITVCIMPMAILGSALVPTLHHTLHHTPHRFLRLVIWFTAVTGLIYTIICLIGVWVAPDIIHLLYGPSYLGPTDEVLRILLISVIAVARYTNIAWSLYALHLEKRHMIATGIGVVTNIILNLIFIPRYGLTAAAWTTLVTELVAATIMTVKFFVTVASLRQSYSRSKEI